MTNSLHIHGLRAENFKRLTVVDLKFGPGATSIVGRNGQGKSSVMDAIACALGGRSMQPEMPIRSGKKAAEIDLDLGDLRVRRRITGGDSKLEVVARDGTPIRSPQEVLDRIRGDLTFDPLAFARMKPKEQATTLARITGVDMVAFDARRKSAYDARTDVNRSLARADAQLSAMPEVDAPDEPVIVRTLLAEAQAARLHNTSIDNAKKRLDDLMRAVGDADRRCAQLNEQLKQAVEARSSAEDAAKTATSELASISATRRDVSVIEAKVADASAINDSVAAKKQRASTVAERANLAEKVASMTAKIEALDAEKLAAVAKAKLPVDGLAFDADGVSLNGFPFSQAASSEQLRASFAIGCAANPKLRLMLVKDGPLLDADGMAMLAELAEQNDMQALVERIDDGKEFGIVIVDGTVAEVREPEPAGV